MLYNILIYKGLHALEVGGLNSFINEIVEYIYTKRASRSYIRRIKYFISVTKQLFFYCISYKLWIAGGN
jgi:hypothetical protein